MALLTSEFGAPAVSSTQTHSTGYVATFDFVATCAENMSIRTGDILENVFWNATIPSDFRLGTKVDSGESGTFPVNCITQIASPAPAPHLMSLMNDNDLHDEDRELDAWLNMRQQSRRQHVFATTEASMKRGANGLSKRLNRAILVGTLVKPHATAGPDREKAACLTTVRQTNKTTERVLYVAKPTANGVHVDVFARSIDPSSVELCVACTGGVVRYSTLDPVSGTEAHEWHFETRGAVNPGKSSFKVKRSKLELILIKAPTTSTNQWVNPCVWQVEPRDLEWDYITRGDGRIRAPSIFRNARPRHNEPFSDLNPLASTTSTVFDEELIPLISATSHQNGCQQNQVAASIPPLETTLPLLPQTSTMTTDEKIHALEEWLDHATKMRHELETALEAHHHALSFACARGESSVRRQHALDLEACFKRHENRVLEANSERDQRVAHSTHLLDREIAKCQQQLADGINGLSFTVCRGDGDLSVIAERIAEVHRAIDETQKLGALLNHAQKRPHEHFCPITTEIMEDPVLLTTCGDTFERAAISEWLQLNPTCPLCRKRSNRRTVVANNALKKLIIDWNKV